MRHALLLGLSFVVGCAGSAPPAAAPRRAGPPPGFERAARVDVDRDGRDDLVLRPPALPAPSEGPRADFTGMPPAVIAHALPDGSYATDDDLTRAALRAMCPARPAAISTPASVGERGAEVDRVALTETLYVEGVCARAWGATADESAARVRALASASGGAVDAPTVEQVIAAVREAVVPLRLTPREAAPLERVRRAETASGGTSRRAEVDPRCADVERENAAVIERANAAAREATRGDEERTTPAITLDARTCVATEAGRWTLRLGEHRVAREPSARVEVTAALRWEPRGGAASEPMAFEQSAEEFVSTTVSVEAASDYDGDGAPEVFVRTQRWEHEGHPSDTMVVVTARGGATARYARAPSEGVLRAVDADGDGRLDLVLDSPWTVTDLCGLAGIEHDGPTLLAHATPDGGFSRTDAVARAWAERECATVHPRDVNDPVDVYDVACARVRGRSADEVVEALRGVMTPGPSRPPAVSREGLCLSFHELAAAALVSPPFSAAR